ncbi:hypothetical protein B0H11DRAFT_2274047 [Mycena galericulata]|nr:hypothetical protein B0H11DRAFT_2274047 [Mycena galericulata]
MGDGVGCAKHIRLRIPAHELIAAGKTTLERWERKSETFQAEDISQLTWPEAYLDGGFEERNPCGGRAATWWAPPNWYPACPLSSWPPSSALPSPPADSLVGQPRLAPTVEARVALLANNPQTPLKRRQDAPSNAVAVRSDFFNASSSPSHASPRDGIQYVHEEPKREPRKPTLFVSGLNSEDPRLQEAQRFLDLSPDIMAATLGDIGVETVERLDEINLDNHAIGTDEYLQRCGA